MDAASQHYHLERLVGLELGVRSCSPRVPAHAGWEDPARGAPTRQGDGVRGEVRGGVRVEGGDGGEVGLVGVAELVGVMRVVLGSEL